MLNNILLSIDWDYFIPIKEEWTGSYIENRRNIIGLWYKRYIRGEQYGENIENYLYVDKEAKEFWENIKKIFLFTKSTPIYISESHKISYKIAKKYNCTEVISFDAHSDLGYGGLQSLDYEVNCANWLGKLLKEGTIKTAKIIYSKYTMECKEQFEEITNNYDVKFKKFKCDCDNNIIKRDICAIHICRSGAWTPPWLDNKFFEFVKRCNFNYKNIDCNKREWNVDKLTLADKLTYLME